MNCPNCDSNNIRKNGQRSGKQNYQCKNCGHQFIESYSPRGYSQEVKEACLYVNGNGFMAIERMTKVNHNTVIRLNLNYFEFLSLLNPEFLAYSKYQKVIVSSLLA